MKVGLQQLFQEHRDHNDRDVYKNELRLCIEADAMGFDFLNPVEHHFFAYSMSPDPSQTLSYLAAKTKQIKLMPTAFILPWNDPLRVVEKIILLDILSEGRAILGMGRGLAQKEFRAFRQEFGESRDRFDEAAEMIIRGLETGFVEGHGKFYKQPRVEVRPRRMESFQGRQYMVGMSPASVDVAARLGLGCLKFSNMAWEEAAPEINAYKSGFRTATGYDAPPIICSDFVAISHDPKRAEEIKDKYTARYHTAVIDHYEMKGSHFAVTKGYESYAEASKELNTSHAQELIDGWVAANLVGTPEMILEKLQKRRELIGDFDITINIQTMSMPYELVREQLKLWAEEVMPVIKSWTKDPKERTAAQ